MSWSFVFRVIATGLLFGWFTCCSPPELVPISFDFAEPCPSTEEVIDNGIDMSVENKIVPIGLLATDIGVCTGTLINKCTVLTAAHCVIKEENKKITSSLFFINSIRVEGKDIIVSSYYDSAMPVNEKMYFDVALIKLVKSINIPFYSIPIQEDTLLESGTSIDVWGYGKSSTGGSGTLRKDTGKINIANDFIMQFTGASVCPGDSGGPSFFEGTWNQIGIHSVTSNTNSAGCGKLGTDARVRNIAIATNKGDNNEH
jgi:V8-like Glu-specific endopeptidase